MIARFLAYGLLVIPLCAEVMTVPDPYVDFPADRTVVWSPLFQATWDAMDREMGGKPTRIDPPNALMERLDDFQWKPETVLPESGWKVWGGRATPESVKLVNEEAQEMFGKADFKVVDPVNGSIACFGMLQRDVEFVTPFHRSMRVPMSFGQEGHSVRFFGALGEQSERYGNRVKVLSYRPVDRSFALEIDCKGEDDKVVLYRPAKRQDFSRACAWIRQWRAGYDPQEALTGSWEDRVLHRDDEVRIPYVAFDTVAEMKDKLRGDRWYEGSPVPWFISRAEQKTKFELHEKGARVRVETSIQMDPFAGAPATVPRKFIFDRPFFIFLWRDKAEWPYLGVWVGDVSGLETMEKEH